MREQVAAAQALAAEAQQSSPHDEGSPEQAAKAWGQCVDVLERAGSAYGKAQQALEASDDASDAANVLRPALAAAAAEAQIERYTAHALSVRNCGLFCANSKLAVVTAGAALLSHVDSGHLTDLIVSAS